MMGVATAWRTPEAVGVAGRDGLLDELDAERLDGADVANRLLDGPGGVGVNPQRLVGDGADALQDFEVASRADLYLQERVAFGLAHLLLHHGHWCDADGERGDGRLGWVGPEELPERLAEPLAHEVVEGDVERPHRAEDALDLGGEGIEEIADC